VLQPIQQNAAQDAPEKAAKAI